MLTLYYAPGACSLADHIALKEAGLEHDLVKVDLKAKTTEDGRDYRKVSPKGAVPAIETEGEVLTENAALLVMIAEKSGKLLPPSGLQRYRVLEATVFIATEIHKAFSPLFKGADADQTAKTKATLKDKFDHLGAMLGGGDFLAGGALSIADCYAFVMLLWADRMDVAVPQVLKDYRNRLRQRSAFQQALRAEGLA